MCTCIFLNLCTGTPMWLYVAWKLGMFFCRFRSCYQAHYWSDTVETKTLSWRNQQDDTSGWSEPRKTNLCCTSQTRNTCTHAGHLNTYSLCTHVYTHCLWTIYSYGLVYCQDRHLWFYRTQDHKLNGLKPPLLVNTRSHVNNVCKSTAAFNDVLKCLKLQL